MVKRCLEIVKSRGGDLNNAIAETCLAKQWPDEVFEKSAQHPQQPTRHLSSKYHRLPSISI